VEGRDDDRGGPLVDAASQRVEGASGEMTGSHLLRVQTVDTEWHWLRGAAAVAAARHDRGKLAIADACVHHLERVASPFARVLAAQLGAAAAACRGDRDRARERLEAAIASAELSEMAAHGASARLRLWRLLGGDEGRAMASAAEEWLRAQGVVAPIAFANMLSPGLADVA